MARYSQAEAADLILNAIVNYQRIHHMHPSRRELSDLTHLTLAALEYRLDQMERAGLIQREPNTVRNIRVVEREAG